MKKKGNHNFILLVCMAIMLSSFVNFSIEKRNYSLIAISATEKSPYSAEILWIFKTENGRVYKRLYNQTLDIWLTDWILVK